MSCDKCGSCEELKEPEDFDKVQYPWTEAEELPPEELERLQKILQMIPLETRVIIKREDDEETKGGILVPESAIKYRLGNCIGHIIAVGEDVQEYLVGKKVQFGRYQGFEIEKPVPGKRDKMLFSLIRVSDILGVITKRGDENV